MTEEEAISELKSMSQAELDVTKYETVWWLCCYKGCHNGTRVRDYGISPEYWKKQYGFFSVNDRFILCAHHFKFFKRLKLHYSLDHIDLRIFDNNKLLIMTNDEKIKKRNGRAKIKAGQEIHKKQFKK